VLQKVLANDIKSYECVLRRKGEWIARLKLTAFIEVLNDHTHPLSPIHSENSNARVKERASSTNDISQQILGTELQDVSKAALPSLNNMRRNIRRNRDEHNMPPIPQRRDEIPNLPNDYQITHRTQTDRFFAAWQWSRKIVIQAISNWHRCNCPGNGRHGGNWHRGQLTWAQLARGELLRGAIDMGGNWHRGEMSRVKLTRNQFAQGAIVRGQLSRGNFPGEYCPRATIQGAIVLLANQAAIEIPFSRLILFNFLPFFCQKNKKKH